MNNFYLYLIQMNKNKLYSNEYNEDKYLRIILFFNLIYNNFPFLIFLEFFK